MQSVNSLCLLRLSAIGDVSHAVAMIARIQKHRPDIAITWVIGKIEYQLVKDMPGVEFVVFDKKDGSKGIAELKRYFAGRMFDVLFVMQVAFRANRVSRAIPAKKRVGFDWARSKELHWLFTNTRIAPQTHAHVLEGFMGFADTLGIPRDQTLSWPIPISKEESEWAQEQASALGDFAVISPAASKAERNWLPERYAEVAEHLKSKGLKVILCGGPAPIDRQLGDAIKEATQVIDEDFIGKTSLKSLLALLSHAKLVVAPDTGPAHMATTVGTPVVGLYAHSNPRRTGPYNDLNNVVSVYDEVIQEQKGKPWTELSWGARAKGAELMSTIEVAAVCQKIESVLS